LDLDDTLLRGDKTISDRTITTLEKCRDKGIKLVYATGRGQSAEKLVPQGLFDGYSQMCGAVAYIEEMPVFNKMFSSAETRELLLAADKAGIKIAVEAGGWHYSNFDFPEVWGPDFLECYEKVDFKTLDVLSEKIYAIPRDDSDVELMRKCLPEGLRLTTSRYESFTMILHEDALKANAVAALAEYWGIDVSDVAAFGDDVIDICMIERCGVGVAMENSSDEVKAVADYICDTNENDGVAMWIEENIL